MASKQLTTYPTFWQRLAAAIIDAIALAPISIWLHTFQKSSDMRIVIGTSFLLFLLNAVYIIGLHGRYGQTLGKYILQIKLVASNEKDTISYKQATIREWPLVLTTIGALVYTGIALYPATLQTATGTFAQFNDITSVITAVWGLAELITLLTSEKRRAIHDQLAGTTVVHVGQINTNNSLHADEKES